MSSPIVPTENSVGAAAVFDFIVARMAALGFKRAISPTVTKGQDTEARSIIDRSWNFEDFNAIKNDPISGQTDRMESVVIVVHYVAAGNPWPTYRQALLDADRIQDEFLNKWEDANVQTGTNFVLDGDELEARLSWNFPGEWVFNENVSF